MCGRARQQRSRPRFGRFFGDFVLNQGGGGEQLDVTPRCLAQVANTACRSSATRSFDEAEGSRARATETTRPELSARGLQTSDATPPQADAGPQRDQTPVGASVETSSPSDRLHRDSASRRCLGRCQFWGDSDRLLVVWSGSRVCGETDTLGTARDAVDVPSRDFVSNRRRSCASLMFARLSFTCGSRARSRAWLTCFLHSRGLDGWRRGRFGGVPSRCLAEPGTGRTSASPARPRSNFWRCCVPPHGGGGECSCSSDSDTPQSCRPEVDPRSIRGLVRGGSGVDPRSMHDRCLG